jgi:8-oxo-dGTP pyrophosphatase MutT (NUDIX family)
VAVRCVLRCEERYLFIDLRDNADPFVIPAGGGMEFGEHSRETAIREISEELGVDVAPTFLGVVENHFVHRGERGHDIEFLYIAEVDPTARQSIGNEATESNGDNFPLTWFSLEELSNLEAKVAPRGVLDMLRS